MNKTEKSLLLYLESRCVDHGGLIDMTKMNAADHAIASNWAESGYITYDRLAFACLSGSATQACTLSPQAWEDAAAERRARWKRLHDSRSWYTTAEKREMNQ